MSRVIMKVVREATGEQGYPLSHPSCDECQRTVVIQKFSGRCCVLISHMSKAS